MTAIHEDINSGLLLCILAAAVWLLVRSNGWHVPMVLTALDQVRSEIAGLKKEVHAATIQSGAAMHGLERYEERLKHVEYKTAQHSEELRLLNHKDVEDEDA